MRKMSSWLVLAAVLLLMLPSLTLADSRAALDHDLPDQARALHLKQVSLSTGVTLQYVEKGNPNGIPLIFIHGYTDSWKSFSETLPRISPKYRSLSVTLRGFGDSDKPEAGYSGSDFAADIAAFMDALQIDQAVIVGHSMGSFIAQHVAMGYPDRVLGVVLIGSAARPNNPVVQDLAAYVATLEDPIDPTFVRDFQASTFYRTLPDGFLDEAVSESLKAPARVWKAAAAGVLAEDLSADLGTIAVPTLIAWGDKDAIFSQAEQEELLALVPGAALQVYTETGHAPHVELPDAFVTNLEAFVETLPTK